MNTKNFFFKICLGVGIVTTHYFAVNNMASAVSLNSLSYKSGLENILDIDLEVKTELIPIALDDIFSLWQEIKTENSPLKNSIKAQIEIYQDEQPKLLESLTTSLGRLQFNLDTTNSSNSEVLILSQTDYDDVNRGVYDFKTNLTNNYQVGQRQGQGQGSISEQPPKPGFFKQEILGYTYGYSHAKTNSFSTFQQELSGFSSSSISRNNSYSAPTGYYSNPSKSGSNVAVSIEDIKAMKSRGIKKTSIPLTPQQKALQEQLERQREKLNQRNKRLREKLERDRKKRQEQRARERTKRLKEQKRRSERIAQQQARRNRNR